MTELFFFLFVVFGLLGSAFFSGIETGVISINRLRLKHYLRKGNRRAGILNYFLEDSDRLLGATLVGNNICNVMVTVFSASFAVRLFGVSGEAVSAFVVVVVLLIFGEYFPKAWFSSRPYHRSVGFADLLRLADRILRPLSVLLVGLTKIFVPGPEKSFVKPLPFVTRDDLKMLTQDSEESGVLSKRETWMIHRVFELSDKKASRIMIPIDGAAKVERNMPVDDFLAYARERKVTRMPVYDEESGEYVGIVNVMYILSSLPSAAEKNVGSFIRPASFIHPGMPVDDIFPRMRRSSQPMILVRDDAGKVLGLITTEDILEEIVGKL